MVVISWIPPYPDLEEPPNLCYAPEHIRVSQSTGGMVGAQRDAFRPGVRHNDRFCGVGTRGARGHAWGSGGWGRNVLRVIRGRGTGSVRGTAIRIRPNLGGHPDRVG